MRPRARATPDGLQRRAKVYRLFLTVTGKVLHGFQRYRWHAKSIHSFRLPFSTPFSPTREKNSHATWKLFQEVVFENKTFSSNAFHSNILHTLFIFLIPVIYFLFNMSFSRWKMKWMNFRFIMGPVFRVQFIDSLHLPTFYFYLVSFRESH